MIVVVVLLIGLLFLLVGHMRQENKFTRLGVYLSAGNVLAYAASIVLVYGVTMLFDLLGAYVAVPWPFQIDDLLIMVNILWAILLGVLVVKWWRDTSQIR